MKYSYEQRLVIVQRVKQGEAIAHPFKGVSYKRDSNIGMGKKESNSG